VASEDAAGPAPAVRGDRGGAPGLTSVPRLTPVRPV
jgi:hypothetical protein